MKRLREEVSFQPKMKDTVREVDSRSGVREWGCWSWLWINKFLIRLISNKQRHRRWAKLDRQYYLKLQNAAFVRWSITTNISSLNLQKIQVWHRFAVLDVCWFNNGFLTPELLYYGITLVQFTASETDVRRTSISMCSDGFTTRYDNKSVWD